jgi:hypothetical protein
VVRASFGVAAPRFAQLQCRTRPDCLRQPRPAVEEREFGEILTVELDQVEDVVDDRVVGHELRRGRADPEALLQPAEGGLLALVGDHLSVEQKVSRLLGCRRGKHLGVGAGEVLAGAGLEPQLAAILAGDAALTVELPLEQKVVAEVATLGQGRQHQRDWHASHHP